MISSLTTLYSGGKMEKKEQDKLLQLARKSIECAFTGDEYTIPETSLRRGAFVTLQKGERLRGCIGYLEGIEPLYAQIWDLAREAAFSDYRFPPLRRDELEFITIEISILTPPAPIDSLSEFIPGRDGIILTGQGRRAVFLPQVATETGWSTTELLEELSLKAGLDRNGWKSASFKTFQAEVFSESAL